MAFLTIGDPSVYSTYGYIHRRIAAWGGNVKMISGVPSFCAAAASLGISLGDNRDEIHVIPGSYEVEETMALSGTRVYMKSGKSLARLKALLEEQQKEKKLSVYCVENCGMADERIRPGSGGRSRRTEAILRRLLSKMRERWYNDREFISLFFQPGMSVLSVP